MRNASKPGATGAAAPVPAVDATDTMMVTLANGMANSGYIPDNASFGANTFQVLSSRFKPGCAEDTIVNGLMSLEQADSE